jgi:hypothetical protein
LSPPIASIADKDADADADGDADEEVDQIVDDVEMAAPSTTTTATTATSTNATTTTKKPTSPETGDKDAEGSPDTDSELSVDEELLKLSSKTKPHPRPDQREYAEVDREFARTDYSTAYPPHPADYGRHYGGWYGEYYHPEEYREVSGWLSCFASRFLIMNVAHVKRIPPASQGRVCPAKWFVLPCYLFD